MDVTLSPVAPRPGDCWPIALNGRERAALADTQAQERQRELLAAYRSLAQSVRVLLVCQHASPHNHRDLLDGIATQLATLAEVDHGG